MRIAPLAFLGFAGWIVASCSSENFETDRQAAEVASLKQQVSELQRRLNALEAVDESPPYKLGDTGFGFVETETGGGTLQWIASKPNGNGTKLSFKIGNPSTAIWNKYTLIGRYGKLKSDGEPDHSTSKPFRIDGTQTIPSGKFQTINVQLDGPKPDDVGFIYIRRILISNVSLIAE